MAQLALLQFLRDCLALGVSPRDRALEYCAYRQEIVTTKITRRTDCVCPHIVYRRCTPPRPLAQCALSELDRNSGASFEVDTCCYAEQAICGCGRTQPVQRFVAPGGGQVGQCDTCQRPLALHPFHSFRAVPASALGDRISRPLRQIGAGDVRWVLVRRGDETNLFLNPEP